jgi:hypothetical protein
VEFLVEFELNVPEGTPESDLQERARHLVWEEAPTDYASIVIGSLTGNRS